MENRNFFKKNYRKNALKWHFPIILQKIVKKIKKMLAILKWLIYNSKCA